MNAKSDLLVFVVSKESSCGECGDELFRGRLITLKRDQGALCLGCADLDHLVFLPSGDAALTRRARKHSTLSAVVLKWSKARKCYERQGLLVEEAGLARAEEECLGDREARARRQEREHERRAALDESYVQEFAARIRRLFPQCPAHTETVIARHACLKYSGRVGRTAAAKAFDAEAVRLAVIAHVRHTHSRYDELLGRSVDRRDARAEVEDEVRAVLAQWEAPTL